MRREQHRFRSVGRRLSDADPWAAKGVLMVELDLGLPGRLEVYSTHLCAGGGLVPRLGRRAVAATDPVRRAQVEELLELLTATHDPANLAVVVGDMNIPEVSPASPDPTGPNRDLLAAFDGAGLYDLWPAVGVGPGSTASLDTNTGTVARRDPDDPRFALDRPEDRPPARGEGRIDRAFVERATPDHRLVVRSVRMRRRLLPRRSGAPLRRRLAHLSDHLGLHVELTLGRSDRRAEALGSSGQRHGGSR